MLDLNSGMINNAIIYTTHSTLSDEKFIALNELIQFNYEHIYNKANSKDMLNEYEFMFRVVFNKCLCNSNKKHE